MMVSIYPEKEPDHKDNMGDTQCPVVGHLGWPRKGTCVICRCRTPLQLQDPLWLAISPGIPCEFSSDMTGTMTCFLNFRFKQSKML